MASGAGKTILIAMEERNNRRKSSRYAITLYTEFVERDSQPSCILNMSEHGFLIRGDLCAGSGGIIHATFKVRPSSGEKTISTKGVVVHARHMNGEYEYGVKIEGFGSDEEELSYREYIAELQAGDEDPRQ